MPPLKGGPLPALTIFLVLFKLERVPGKACSDESSHFSQLGSAGRARDGCSSASIYLFLPPQGKTSLNLFGEGLAMLARAAAIFSFGSCSAAMERNLYSVVAQH